MRDDGSAEKISAEFIERLTAALDEKNMSEKKGNSFFSSPLWCFLALLSLVINLAMVAVIFWQRLHIDYLVTKIIGE